MAHLDNGIFTRDPGNPIITADDLPYLANTVFNAAATEIDGRTLLLMRVEDRRGMSHLTAAISQNGVDNWKIDSSPTLAPDPEAWPEDAWGIEDPRITWLEDEKKWAVTYTSYSRGGPLVSLALTGDFRKFERLGAVLPPENKDAAIFPVRFGGKWAMLHRPYSDSPGAGKHIWIAFSPDLRHWGAHRILIPAREGGWWDAAKIGLSAPPLPTEDGWLILYHGVRETAAGSLYRCGLALLDIDDPTRLLKRSDEWIFSPQAQYERIGDVGDVVFPCGWMRDGDKIRLYYGAADTCICLAHASLRDLMDCLK